MWCLMVVEMSIGVQSGVKILGKVFLSRSLKGTRFMPESKKMTSSGSLSQA